MGCSAVPMLLSVIGTVGTRVVWIFMVFPKYRSLDIFFISYPASWLVTIALQVVCYYFVRKKVKSEFLEGKKVTLNHLKKIFICYYYEMILGRFI